MEKNENVLDAKVIERLDKIDWNFVKEEYGVSRESVEGNPRVASQLAYGAMTDLIPFRLKGIVGEVSLRAFPTPADSGSPWKVKGYTKQDKPHLEDYISKDPSRKPAKTLYFYGEPLTSAKAIRSLLEETSWKGVDGQTKFGRANASTGMPVSFAFKKRDENGNVMMAPDGKTPLREEKRSYILSIHGATNQLVGIAVDKLKERLKAEKGVSMYGVNLTEEEISNVVNGRAVILKGCKNSDGETFNVPVQFDVAKMSLVPVHPVALKEVMKMGADLDIYNDSDRSQSAAAETKKAETKKAAAKKEEAPAKKNRIKIS